MLIRDLEESIFDETRKWLEKDDSVFYLVVDELHSYRGTSGTEVAYLLRTLFSRLGLKPDSPKLRIIASSASLEGEYGDQYLKQFLEEVAVLSELLHHQLKFLTIRFGSV